MFDAVRFVFLYVLDAEERLAAGVSFDDLLALAKRREQEAVRQLRESCERG